jgi:lambda family phage tail tape measure protein
MAQNIARLGVVLGLDTAEFQKGLDSAKRSVTDLANKIPMLAAIGAAAFTGMVAKSLQFADSMQDLSDATGVSVAKIIQISDALEMSGGNAADAGKMIEKFASNIDAAAQGSKPLQDAFARVGVTLEDLRRLSTEDLLKKTSDGISGLGDKATQTGSKVELLSRAMRGVDMESFNAKIQEGAQEYEKYQNAVAQTAEMHDKLAKKTMMLTLSFTQHLMPTVVAMFDRWGQSGGLAEKTFETINKLLLGLWYAAGSVSNAFGVMGVYWDKFTGKIDSGKAQEELRKIYADQLMFRGKLQALDKPSESTKRKTPEEVSRKVTAAKDTEADKQKQMLYTASLISDEYQRQIDFSLKQLETRNAMVGMTADERRIQEAINQQLDSTSKKIDEITKAREAAAGRGANAEVLAEYDKQIEKVQEIGRVSAEAAKTIETASIESQRTFSFGWDKAFAQYAEDAYNYGKMGADMFNSLTNSMTSAIDKFVDTGKFSFSDFTQSILKDLIKIQLRMMAMQMFSKAIGLATGFFGGGGPEEVSAITSIIPRAEGGPVNSNATHLVGERGPEIFVPRTAGTIIPNNQLSNMMGNNAPQNVFNGPYIANMSAIDTQSGVQFLAKNKMAVWSANQSASRTIPTSR